MAHNNLSCPPQLLIGIAAEASKRGSMVIEGVDTNAHDTIWSGSDINKSVESLFEFILSNNLTIRSTCDEPTFIIAARRNLFDVSLSLSPNKCNVV